MIRPSASRYMVTVRSLERLERAPMIRRRFKRAWDELKRRAAEILAVPGSTTARCLPGVFRRCCSIRRPRCGLTWPRSEKQGARCVVLREPPCATALDQLNAVLDTTTPAIVWCEDLTRTPGVEKTIRDLLQSVPIAELPRRFRDERATMFRSGAWRRTDLTSDLGGRRLPPARTRR